MDKLSATKIGDILGLSAREVNKYLEKIGFIKESNLVTLKGSKTWDITDVGKIHGEMSPHPYSNGYVWNPVVVDILKKTFKLK